MGNLLDLFKGVAVVIDDEINSKDSSIKSIEKHLDDANIPYLEFDDIPSDEIVNNFSSLSFIILDWKLTGMFERNSEIRIPPERLTERNIDFIRKIQAVTYCPIFIFTDESTEDVQDKLSEANIRFNEPAPLYVKSKATVNIDGLTTVLTDWLAKTPQIYLLKELDRELKSSTNQLFRDFEQMSTNWPSILLQSYSDDSITLPHYELRSLLLKNLENRFSIPQYREDILSNPSTITPEKFPTDEIRKVLESARFITKESLGDQDPAPGDLFINPNSPCDKRSYLLNIRAQCDLLRNLNPDLYCLKGVKLSEDALSTDSDNSGKYTIHAGQIIPKTNNQPIPFIVGSIIDFKFTDLKIKPWKELKEYRVGRILPPFIDVIQQRYSFYFHRAALPRIPGGVFSVQTDTDVHEPSPKPEALA